MSTAVSIADLKRMTVTELRKELSVRRAEAAKIRMGLEMQSEKNSSLYRVAKRDVARMCMVLADLEKAERSGKKADPKVEVVSEKSASQEKKKSVKGVSSRKKKTS